MSVEDVAVLVNPVAGAGRGVTVGREVVARLAGAGRRVRELVGSTASQAEDLAVQAVSDGIPVLVAVGGDGMVHTAIQALAGTSTALAVVPCGTGNDFARSLGIPRKSLLAAVDVVTDGRREAIDLGRVGDRWFAAVLASGFDSKVNDRGNRMRWPHGRVRYNLAMVAELASFRPLDYRISLDGEDLDITAMLVAVGNGPSYGGGMKICPAASLTDGLLDVTVVSRLSRAKLVRLFPSVYSGTHLRYAEVLTFRATSVSLNAPDVTAYADGEFVGQLPVTCTAVPGALNVLVPSTGAAVHSASKFDVGEQGATGPRAGQSPPDQ